MDNPCKHCDQKSIDFIVETLSPGCNHPCAQFNEFAGGVSKYLDEMLAIGEAILKKHEK